MSWSLAPSLDACRREANAIAPKRSKASDGTIGDAAHSSRTSDHNPGARDRVHALDLTHDPANGWDVHARVEQLRRSQDRRIKYLISNGRIAGPGSRYGGWGWNPYTGANPHTRHAHISIHSTVAAETDTRPWWPDVVTTPPLPAAPQQEEDDDMLESKLVEMPLANFYGLAELFVDFGRPVKPVGLVVHGPCPAAGEGWWNNSLAAIPRAQPRGNGLHVTIGGVMAGHGSHVWVTVR